MQLHLETSSYKADASRVLNMSPVINPKMRNISKMSSILATRSLAATKSRPSAAIPSDQLRPAHPSRPSKYNSDLDLLLSQERDVSRNVTAVE